MKQVRDSLASTLNSQLVGSLGMLARLGPSDSSTSGVSTKPKQTLRIRNPEFVKNSPLKGFEWIGLSLAPCVKIAGWRGRRKGKRSKMVKHCY